jgi:hypothetical protein
LRTNPVAGQMRQQLTKSAQTKRQGASKPSRASNSPKLAGEFLLLAQNPFLTLH